MLRTARILPRAAGGFDTLRFNSSAGFPGCPGVAAIVRRGSAVRGDVVGSAKER